ncbi:MAG: S9 family peptidase, partial [Planctomycetota bacterium]
MFSRFWRGPILCLFLAVLALSSCAQQNMRETAAGKFPRYKAETFFDTRSIFGSSFDASESKILVTSDETGVYNCYSLSLASGKMKALTDSKGESIFGVGWFPKDDRFLYSADQGGNELNHLFVQKPDGTVVDLTPGEKLKATFLGWSGDDSSFLVVTNERDARYFDLYQYQASAPYRRTLVFENQKAYSIGGVSRDGRWIALTKVHSNDNDDLYLSDVQNPRQGAKL